MSIFVPFKKYIHSACNSWAFYFSDQSKWVSDWCLMPTKQFWYLFVWYFADCFILSPDILLTVLSFHLMFICLIFWWLKCFLLSPDIYFSDIFSLFISVWCFVDSHRNSMYGTTRLSTNNSVHWRHYSFFIFGIICKSILYYHCKYFWNLRLKSFHIVLTYKDDT